MKRTFSVAVAMLAVGVAWLSPSAIAAEPPCELKPKVGCFGVESLSAALSSDQPDIEPNQAGAHPDITFTFELKQDPESEPNAFGLRNAYAPTRNVRIELPPGLVGEPNSLGVPQQCTATELARGLEAECPNGSQIGVANIYLYQFTDTFLEPIYLMQAPGGDVIARLGFIAGIFPAYIDVRLRSEDQNDYGLTFEISDASTEATLLKSEATTWGVPAAKSHNNERCTPGEAFLGCEASPARPPGSVPLPLITNPTRCGVPLELRVGAASWAEPDRFDTKAAAFPEIIGCDRLPFGPSLTVEPTSRRAGAPTGVEARVELPASDGVNVLEPSQMKEVRVALPDGVAFNPGAADGLVTCSAAQVRFGTREASQCPDAAKVADTEFDIPALPRRMKGAVYLREPEPGRLFRAWIVADDLGAHIKLPGELEVDEATGQIETVVLNIPQAPVREARFNFKSGFRAALLNPQACGTFDTAYEFVPWSGGPPEINSTPMTIDEGCEGLGTFSPKLSAGTTDPAGGTHSPFLFTLTREDGEQNPQGLDISLPTGLAATFAGIARCEGAAAETGACPVDSRIGKVVAAVGAGPAPLWVPQEGKRPTAVYLSGPYKGAPLSIVAVVPKQAGPFDFGDEVVRSAIYVDPVTARATAKADPLPQLIEGIPVNYRTIHVILDRPDFTLNPTSCAQKATEATLTSSEGAVAHPSSPFAAVNCAKLGFKPRISLKLQGGTRRGSHPALTAVVRPRAGDANIAAAAVTLPHSAFLDQAHIRTICTRVQFAAAGGNGKGCPAGSIYGHARAKTPLFDEPLEGPVYLRSSSHNLPDMVFALHGPASLPIEIEAVGRIDSVKGGIRSSFEAIPDAPLSEVVLEMEGGKKGLIVNSTNLCASTNRAKARLTGQNGKVDDFKPLVRAQCGKGGKHKGHKKYGKRAALRHRRAVR